MHYADGTEIFLNHPKKLTKKNVFFQKKKRIEKPKMKKMNKKTSRNPYR